MAAFKRRISMRDLRSDANLRRFVLEDAQKTNNTLGTGSYGSVEEVHSYIIYLIVGNIYKCHVFIHVNNVHVDKG